MFKWQKLQALGLLYAEDGGGDGGGAPAAGEPAAVAGAGGGAGEPAGGQAPAAPKPQPPAAAPDGQQPAEVAFEDLPPSWQQQVKALRAEAGAARTQAKADAAEAARAELMGKLTAALGIEGEEPPTPEQLTSQLTESQQAARVAQVELAVYRAASQHKGDPDALLDSRTFLADVAGLDPTAQDFNTKVADLIKKAVTENPKLRAGQVSGASALERAGGSGEPPKTPSSLQDAVAAAYAGK